MMRSTFLSVIAVLLILSVRCSAQQAAIDSLERLVSRKTIRDTVTVNRLNRLSVLCLFVDPARAAKTADKARGIARKLGFHRGHAEAEYNLACAALYRNRIRDAAAHARISLRLRERESDVPGTIRSLLILGRAYYLLRSDSARDCYDRAALLAGNTGDTAGKAGALAGIGRLLMRTDRKGAREYLDRSLALFEQVCDTHGTASTLYALGFLSMQERDLKTATFFLDRSVALIEKTGDRYMLATIMRVRGQVHTRLGNLQEGERSFETALYAAESVGHDAERQSALTGLGIVYNRLGKQKEAMAIYRNLESVQRENRDTAGLIVTRINLGDLYHQRGQHHDALACFSQALADAERRHDEEKWSIALMNLGVVSAALGNSSEALGYFRRCLPLKTLQRDRDGMATLLNNMGALHAGSGDLDSAQACFHESLRLAEEVGAKVEMIRALQNIGMVHMQHADYENALKAFLRSLTLAEESGHKESIASAQRQIAFLYGHMFDGEKALEYGERSMRLYEALGSPNDSAAAYQIYALRLMGVQRYEEAMTWLERSLAIYERIRNLTGMGIVYNNMSGIHEYRGDLPAAVRVNARAIAIFEQAGDEKQLARALHNQGTYLRKLGRVEEASAAFERGNTLAKQTGAISEIMDLEHEMSRAARARGDFEAAYTHHINYVEIKDSLWIAEKIRSTEKLAAQFESEKKEKQISLLKTEGELSSLKLRQQAEELLRRRLQSEHREQEMRLLAQAGAIQSLTLDSTRKALDLGEAEKRALRSETELLKKREELNRAELGRRDTQRYALGAGMLLLAVIAVLLLRRVQARRREALLRAEAATAETHRLAAESERRQKETHRVYAQQLIQTQERERERIATDLHDSLGQELVVIKNRAMMALRHMDDPQKLRSQLQQVSDLSGHMLEDIRAIAHHLRPLELDRLGLTATLQGVAHELREATPIRIQADIDPIDGLFGKEQEIILYRIVQEALGNAVKHANATAVTVRLKQMDGRCRIEITDDGKGFLPEDTGTKGGNGRRGLGLSGMHERVHMLDGTMNIDAAPGEGTSITIDLPLLRKDGVPSAVSS
ncbi:MAG: tetratricopeptide repeat protein [Bacteroidetes bacterium]|nr:tetratricopeptide repeat protein [Bacteroidota bacterium]